MEVKNELISIICDTFEKLGAPMQVLCAVGSIGDTLTDDEVIEQLEAFNNGTESLTIIVESDDAILFDANQASIREQNKAAKQPPEKE